MNSSNSTTGGITSGFLVTGSSRIPRLHVVTLERLAAVDGKTVSTVLARELRDLVSVHAEWLSAEVSGFSAALHWPACAG